MHTAVHVENCYGCTFPGTDIDGAEVGFNIIDSPGTRLYNGSFRNVAQPVVVRGSKGFVAQGMTDHGGVQRTRRKHEQLRAPECQLRISRIAELVRGVLIQLGERQNAHV